MKEINILEAIQMPPMPFQERNSERHRSASQSCQPAPDE